MQSKIERNMNRIRTNTLMQKQGNAMKKKQTKSKKVSNGTRILEHRYLRNDPEMQELVLQEFENLQIAQQIYDLRQQAGLSQDELASLIGTKGSVISRLEDANYTGHSIKMLERLAIALGKRIELRIVDRKTKRRVS